MNPVRILIAALILIPGLVFIYFFGNLIIKGLLLIVLLYAVARIAGIGFNKAS